MKVTIDTSLCTGHGRCYTLAGDVFESDDEGYSVLRYPDGIPPELEASARRAVEGCPEQAIKIIEE